MPLQHRFTSRRLRLPALVLSLSALAGTWPGAPARAADDEPAARADAATVRENVDGLYGGGYLRFRFGMSPQEVNDRCGIRVNPEWGGMPVASEYKGAEVRYFWHFLSDVKGLPQYLGGKCSKASYVCFLFVEGRLFRVSLRFLDGADVNDHSAILRDFANDIALAPGAAEAIDKANEKPAGEARPGFTIRTGKVLFYGVTRDQNGPGTYVEFIQKGSPEFEGQNAGLAPEPGGAARE